MPARHMSRFALPIALALAAPAFGCGGTTAEPPATGASATTRAPVAQNAHGMVKLAGQALADVPLTASQRTEIEQLAADAETRHAESLAARKDLTLAIATQVEAGRIDRGALQPKIDALVVAMQRSQPADRTAFEQLHAVLGPDQRTAFVDALEARFVETLGHRGHGHPLKAWADDLQLSDDQRTQIKSIFTQRFQAAKRSGGDAPWAEMSGQRAKVLDAFRQDRFVLNEVAPAADVQAKANKMTDHMIGIAEQVIPILTPQQRTIAAQKLRTRADVFEVVGPAGQ